MEYTPYPLIYKPIPTLPSQQPTLLHQHHPASYAQYGLWHASTASDPYSTMSTMSLQGLYLGLNYKAFHPPADSPSYAFQTPIRRSLPQSLPTSPCSPASDCCSSPTTAASVSPALDQRGKFDLIFFNNPENITD